MGKFTLSMIREEVLKAREEIKKDRVGADVPEAKKRLKEAAEHLKKSNSKKAFEVIKEAQIIAHPTTDHLMAEGKKLSAEAKGSYDKKSFADAISSWENSKDFYERALKLSDVREDGLSQDIKGALKKIENNIETSKKARDKSLMDQAMNQGAKLRTGGKNPLDKARYLENALGEYTKALELATKWEFSEKSSLNVTISDIDNQIRKEFLAEGKRLLEESKTVDEFKKAEDFVLSLENNQWFKGGQEGGKRASLLAKAKSSQLKTRIDGGREMLKEAKILLNKGEDITAKDMYKEAKEHFIEISAYADRHDVLDQKEEADSLIVTARKGLDSILKGLGEVEEVEDLITGLSGGRFQIDEGSRKGGGYSDVFRAFDTNHNCTVALKKYHIKGYGTCPEKPSNKFRNEASIWKELCKGDTHKNVVTLYDYDSRPSPWLALEYMDNGSLQDKLNGDVKESLDIIKEVIQGLAYAHEKDIAHLDISPGNVLFNSQNEVKLTDWGQSKFVDSAKREGVLYTTRGKTRQYAAPEQFDESYGERDIVTDIWQMGAVLYHLTTKKLPFEPDKLGFRGPILNQEPKPPRELNPKISPKLNEVILTCLKKDKKDRYNNATELRNALEDL